jgi:predicted Zn-dependent protease
LELARQLFDQAVTHYPGFEHALIGLARTLIALGRPGDALRPLQAALKISPDSDVAYYQLAQAYRSLGNTSEQEKALAEFTRVHAIATRRTAVVPQPKQDVTPQVLDLKLPK